MLALESDLELESNYHELQSVELELEINAIIPLRSVHIKVPELKKKA